MTIEERIKRMKQEPEYDYIVAIKSMETLNELPNIINDWVDLCNNEDKRSAYLECIRLIQQKLININEV